MLSNKYYVTYPKLKKKVHMGSSDIQTRVWEAQLVKELKQGDLLVTSCTTENSRVLNFMASNCQGQFLAFFVSLSRLFSLVYLMVDYSQITPHCYLNNIPTLTPSE